jgi:hypothetical protein
MDLPLKSRGQSALDNAFHAMFHRSRSEPPRPSSSVWTG